MKFEHVQAGRPLPLNPDARGELRLKVRIDGWLCSSQVRRHFAELTDISVNGCRVLSPFQVAIGCALVVRIAELAPLHATVRWCTVDALGLQFSSPLDARIVEMISNANRIAAGV